jgi:hypothetical protein
MQDKHIDEKKLAKSITNSLKSFGYISGQRKCYTPKYGEGAYTIEEWDAKTVGLFLAGDIASIIENEQLAILERLLEKKLWVDLADDKKRNKTKWRFEAVPIEAIQQQIDNIRMAKSKFVKWDAEYSTKLLKQLKTTGIPKFYGAKIIRSKPIKQEDKNG